jgi:hypothetical protein
LRNGITITTAITTTTGHSNERACVPARSFCDTFAYEFRDE